MDFRTRRLMQVLAEARKDARGIIVLSPEDEGDHDVQIPGSPYAATVDVQVSGVSRIHGPGVIVWLDSDSRDHFEDDPSEQHRLERAIASTLGYPIAWSEQHWSPGHGKDEDYYRRGAYGVGRFEFRDE